uniref:Predicted protein n=1 Tax=Hordeum vulgare subsp. vulgare TaxID=112509 RepID=F2DXU7_HORVV|nr:predicted protein [Hordeum vulgare subsp. vulgare]
MPYTARSPHGRPLSGEAPDHDVPMEGEGGGVEDGRGRWSPVLLCPLPLSARSKKHQAPHLHHVSSPTSATPRRAHGAESRKHDAGCGGVRRARPVVFSL